MNSRSSLSRLSGHSYPTKQVVLSPLPSFYSRSLQFQGELVYGTLCHNCRSKSERTSDFLELEINIEVIVLSFFIQVIGLTSSENNTRLEDRIAALLQNEKLTGDNKWDLSLFIQYKSITFQHCQIFLLELHFASGRDPLYRATFSSTGPPFFSPPFRLRF